MYSKKPGSDLFPEAFSDLPNTLQGDLMFRAISLVSIYSYFCRMIKRAFLWSDFIFLNASLASTQMRDNFWSLYLATTYKKVLKSICSYL